MLSKPGLPGTQVLFQTASGTVGHPAGRAVTRWINRSATARLTGGMPAPGGQGRSPMSTESSQPHPRQRGERRHPQPLPQPPSSAQWKDGSLRATPPPTTTPTRPPALIETSLPSGSNRLRQSWRQSRRQPERSSWAEGRRQPLPVQKTVLCPTNGHAPRALSQDPTEAPTPPSMTMYQGCQSRILRSWSLRDLRPE